MKNDHDHNHDHNHDHDYDDGIKESYSTLNSRFWSSPFTYILPLQYIFIMFNILNLWVKENYSKNYPYVTKFWIRNCTCDFLLIAEFLSELLYQNLLQVKRKRFGHHWKVA